MVYLLYSTCLFKWVFNRHERYHKSMFLLEDNAIYSALNSIFNVVFLLKNFTLKTGCEFELHFIQFASVLALLRALQHKGFYIPNTENIASYSAFVNS